MDNSSINLLWITSCGLLVIAMQVGVLLLAYGRERASRYDRLASSFLFMSTAFVIFLLLGHELMYFSADGRFPLPNSLRWGEHNPTGAGLSFLFFQAMLAGASTSIVLGWACPRWRVTMGLVVTAAYAGLAYPLFGHWVWGGVHAGATGWLAGIGFVDFAGSTVVHASAGWLCLAAALTFPRSRPPESEHGDPLRPNGLVLMGSLLVCLGSLGVNGGSPGVLDERVGSILVNTILASGGGMLVAMAVGWRKRGFPDSGVALEGMLTGLAAIGAGCHAMSARSAFLVGSAAGLLPFVSDAWSSRSRREVGFAVRVHAGGGLWGTLAVAFFLNAPHLGTIHSRIEQILVQLTGVAAAFLWFFVAPWLAFQASKRCLGEQALWAGIQTTEEQSQENAARHSVTKTGTDIDVLHRVNGVARSHFPSALHGDVADSLGNGRGEELSESALGQIIDNALDAVVTMDAEGRVTAWNAQAETVFGWSRSEILGQRMDETIVPPRYQSNFRHGLVRFLETGEGRMVNRRVELTACHRDGHEFPVELSMSATCREESWTFSAFIRDMTEQKRVQHALRQNDELLRAVMNNTTAVIYVKHVDGRYILINREYERLFSVTQLEMFGKTDHDVFPRDVADQFRENDALALAAGSPRQCEEVAHLPDGTHAYLSVKFPLYDEDNIPYAVCGISTDITDRKLLEEELRQAQKMEAVGHLAGGVAHDFNNLLTVILGFGEFLLRRIHPGHPWRMSVEEIQRAGERAASLTQQLLAFSRKQVLLPVVLDLNEQVRNVEIMLRRLIGADIEVVMSLAPNVRPVRADSGQIEQVIVNLAVNARDAMPQGGRLTITTANCPLEDVAPKLRQEFPAADEFVTLTIADTGCGMDEKTIRHVFEPFYTTKELGKGTGLGLATVYGIVRQSGGDITLSSEIGRGTTFTIFLPPAEESLPVAENGPTSFEIPRGKETILLIDDEEGVLHLATQVLASSGYNVLSASRGDEAIAICDAGKAIDMVVTDIVLPGISGPETVRKLREKRPGMRVLYISGYDPMESGLPMVRGLDAPFLQKPFKTAQFAQLVRGILDQELALSPSD